MNNSRNTRNNRYSGSALALLSFLLATDKCSGFTVARYRRIWGSSTAMEATREWQDTMIQSQRPLFPAYEYANEQLISMQGGDRSEVVDEIAEDDDDDREAKSDRENNNSEDGESEDLARRRKAAMARAALLAKRSGPRRTSTRPTSVGERRLGSASRTGAAHNKILDAVRKSALVTTTASPTKKEEPKAAVSHMIHNVIEDMMRTRENEVGGHYGIPVWDEAKLSEAFNSFGRSIGILGEEVVQKQPRIQDAPIPRLVQPRRPAPPVSPVYLLPAEKGVAVRMATPYDDVDIANLRLSVFADFAPDLRSQFCARSCQAIAARRMRGATCVVASVADRTVGSAECSFHEFYGTALGRRRRQSSIMYVTEVAVNPSVRRRGIGTKLLRSIDALAKIKRAETLYLHVDVSNKGAIRLYEKAGYRKVSVDDSMYLEFTTSLNLHPGATKGRDHFLFYKNFKEPCWLEETTAVETEDCGSSLVGVFGFEIPA